MTTTALIEPPELDSDDALAELPPLLSVVPVAGPPVFVPHVSLPVPHVHNVKVRRV